MEEQNIVTSSTISNKKSKAKEGRESENINVKCA